MNITLCFLLFVIYVVYVLPCRTQLSNRIKDFAEICKSAENKNESSVYCMKDYKKKSSIYKYKHLMKFFLDKYKLDNNKLAIVENSRGEPENYITYGTFFKKVFSFSDSLNTYEGTGIPEKIYDEEKNNGKFRLLGLYGNNSTNWLITDFACMMSGVTTLVMHSKFSIDIIIDILNNTKLEWLCLDLDLVEGILNRKNELPYLKKLIILDNLSKRSEKINSQNEEKSNNGSRKSSNKSNYNESGKGENTILASLEYDNEKIETINTLKEKAKTVGLSIILFDNMTQKEVTNVTIQNEDPNFIASIVYTSGTSGTPKGVMLSNKNLYNGVIPLCDCNILKKYPPTTHLSYLPVSHVYERILVFIALFLGVKLNIWSRDIKFLNTDICNSRGEIILGVPKVFNRMYATIMTEINNLSRCKRWIAKQAINLRKGKNNGNFSKVVEGITNISSKIKEKINPNMDVILNGGGKLSPEVAEGLSVLLNVNYYQGYGLTESTGPIFLQDAEDSNTESMGVAVSPSTRYKVRTWEIYTATDTVPKGELLIKSDSMFSGYFLEKECTENAFTKDGYFKTGDIVQINDNGSLTFLDRSKGLVKLSQGEYIETEMINNLYSQIPFVNFCVAYGDDSMDGPLGILSVDKYKLFISLKNDNMLKITGLDERNFSEKIIDEILNETIYVDYVKGKMMEIFKKTNLNRYNVINDIYLTSKPWDTTNYLTPTLKIRRFNVFKDFSFFIDDVKKKYEEKLKGSSTGSMNNGKSGSKDDIKNGSKDDIKNGSKDEIKKGSKVEIKKESKNEIRKGSKDEIKKGSKDEIRKGSKDEIRKGSKDEIKKENKDEIKKENKDEIKNGSQNEKDALSKDIETPVRKSEEKPVPKSVQKKALRKSEEKPMRKEIKRPLPYSDERDKSVNEIRNIIQKAPQELQVNV
ncbi:acyl-CoA synthetase [Plasmodium sp. gorilla clade G2]|uniref:acyl-CoA synthetase n=1 Tax=Plasmodium sp. gorilla clade G2 TaxID=880535 RepID=UPI000D22C831|nr:acyl-CoA synthetase [Plasmodium sp. gorilla clade G2]SOV16416.1 acyl-CoA synthetase [Plasmodium sp. gorilla clade G2]